MNPKTRKRQSTHLNNVCTTEVSDEPGAVYGVHIIEILFLDAELACLSGANREDVPDRRHVAVADLLDRGGVLGRGVQVEAGLTTGDVAGIDLGLDLGQLGLDEGLELRVEHGKLLEVVVLAVSPRASPPGVHDRGMDPATGGQGGTVGFGEGAAATAGALLLHGSSLVVIQPRLMFVVILSLHHVAKICRYDAVDVNNCGRASVTWWVTGELTGND